MLLKARGSSSIAALVVTVARPGGDAHGSIALIRPQSLGRSHQACRSIRGIHIGGRIDDQRQDARGSWCDCSTVSNPHLLRGTSATRSPLSHPSRRELHSWSLRSARDGRVQSKHVMEPSPNASSTPEVLMFATVRSDPSSSRRVRRGNWFRSDQAEGKNRIPLVTPAVRSGGHRDAADLITPRSGAFEVIQPPYSSMVLA